MYKKAKPTRKQSYFKRYFLHDFEYAVISFIIMLFHCPKFFVFYFFVPSFPHEHVQYIKTKESKAWEIYNYLQFYMFRSILY